jgi:hypothetical protein
MPMPEQRMEDRRNLEEIALAYRSNHDVMWLLDALAGALERERALRDLLTDRQRYIHAEIHVDGRGAPIGHWSSCDRPTCVDTREKLAALGSADAAREGGTISVQELAATPCNHCGHPAGDHSLGAREGNCDLAACDCREPRFTWPKGFGNAD